MEEADLALMPNHEINGRGLVEDNHTIALVAHTARVNVIWQY
jgi:hypothetical protein